MLLLTSKGLEQKKPRLKQSVLPQPGSIRSVIPEYLCYLVVRALLGSIKSVVPIPVYAYCGPMVCLRFYRGLTLSRRFYGDDRSVGKALQASGRIEEGRSSSSIASGVFGRMQSPLLDPV